MYFLSACSILERFLSLAALFVRLNRGQKSAKRICCCRENGYYYDALAETSPLHTPKSLRVLPGFQLPNMETACVQFENEIWRARSETIKLL
jgi:hypothetical protein